MASRQENGELGGVCNPLRDDADLEAAQTKLEEEELEDEKQFEQEAEGLKLDHPESPTVDGRRAQLELTERAAKRLEERFKSCFDAMDVNEDGVIANDRNDPELRAALQLQGLEPSETQLDAWRADYGEEFTREQFVDAMAKFVSEQPGEFSASEWSHWNTTCVRLDCFPVGKDRVRITPDTITIERTKCRMCFCGCKRLGDTLASNLETSRSRWIHIHAPLLQLHWVTAHLFEGILVYCGVVFLGAILAFDFTDKHAAIKEMQWSQEKVVAIRELWFGENVIAGLVVCCMWWLLRLYWQIASVRGHAFIYAIGNTPPVDALGDADETKGRFAVAWAECENVVDEFLAQKGCYMQKKEVVSNRKIAEKKTELFKVVTGVDARLAEFRRAEFVVEGLKELQGTAMNGISLGVIAKTDMTKALMNEPDQQVKCIADMLLEPALRQLKEAGLEVLRNKRHSYENLVLDELKSKLTRRLRGRIEPAALERSADEPDDQYKKRIIDLAMSLAEVAFGFRLDPTAEQPKGDETETEYQQRLEQLPPIEGSQHDRYAKKLKSQLLDRAGVSRAEQFLGSVKLDQHTRAAHLNPVYSDGVWNTKPGGRWYVWKRWWMGEETSLYIGENTFKASSVLQCGPLCRRREHLASSVEDLVWVHAAKKGRSVGRICDWTWRLMKVLVLLSLAVAVMWSISFPDCNQNVGCEHLQLAGRINYKNCESECEASSCGNLTCARFNTCDDIIMANRTTAIDVRDMCSAADAVYQAQSLSNFSAYVASQLSEFEQTAACDAATKAAERVRTAALNLPASCNHAYDAAKRAKAYKLYLGMAYLGRDGAWLGAVARLGGGSCALAAAVDKCSGCRGSQRCSRETVGESYQSQTHRGELITETHFPFQRVGMYPSDYELCSAIAEAGKLSTSEFCPNITFSSEWSMIRKPCICSNWWEAYVPDKEAFLVTFAVLFAVGWFVVLYIWLRWVPETMDFGLLGMQYSSSTSGFTMPPGESIMATIDVLETKLGREVSLSKVHKPWVYRPSFRYISLALHGFEESMTVYEDFVHVTTHTGVPICCSKRLCSCCCCDPHGIWADEDNYFLPLQNVTFIEVGTNFFWLFDFLSQFSAKLGFFFLLVEYVFMEPLQMLQDVIVEMSIDIHALDDSLIMVTWSHRYQISAACFWLWFTFKVLAGNVWKRGYVSLHCVPGGTARGRASNYVGRSPFFVRLADPDPHQFLQDIASIRAAVRKTRIEAKRRHKERLSQLWSVLVYKDGSSAAVQKFKNRLNAIVDRGEVDGGVPLSTTGRVDLLSTNAFKRPVSRKVELLVRDSKYLEYFETVDQSVGGEAFEQKLEPELDPGGVQELKTLPIVAEAASAESEAAEREEKRNKKGHSGQINLQTVIAVHIKPLGENEADQALLDVGRTNALHVDRVEGSVRFSFKDSDEQTEWQAIIETAARAAQNEENTALGGDGSNFTRYLVQREENQIITDFVNVEEAQTDPERAALRKQVARVFCAIDKNHDRTISLRELTAWLSTASKGRDDVQTAELLDEVKQIFEDANKENHRIRVTLEEFWTLMYDGEVIEKLKKGGLWTHLALRHVFDEKALGEMFDYVVSQSAIEGENYIGIDQLAWCFKHMGMVAPPPSQLAKEMRMFDRSVRGKLSRTQYIELMVEHMRSRKGEINFTAELWCPMEIAGMTLDLIPWGEQVTTIVEDECITRGRTGPFASSETGQINKACKKHLRVEFSLSKAFMTSWEMSKARWLHAEGNPLNLHKLAGYLAEALLLYAIIASDYVQGEIISAKNNVLGPVCCGVFCFAICMIFSFNSRFSFYLSIVPGHQRFLIVNWFAFVAGFWWVYNDSERAFGGAFSPYSAHYIVRLVAIQWWGLRVFMLLFRKIGTAEMFVVGQPLHKQQSRSRQIFPLQISSLQDATDAFSQVKKFNPMELNDAFREATPGYGFIPHDLDRCQCCYQSSRFSRWWRSKVCSKQGCARRWIMRPLYSCRGLHSIYIGINHFELEKNSGGGWRAASNRTAGWRARITRINHVIGFMEDIRWVLVKKKGIAFFDLVRDSAAAMLAVFVLAVPFSLLASYPCSDVLNLRGRDKPGPSAMQRNPNSLSWAKWSTFNSTATQMVHFDGAQDWCDAFDESGWWFLEEIEVSSAKTHRPCVCPLRPGEICNPNLDPSLYFRSWGQPKWCSNWEQATQFYEGKHPPSAWPSPSPPDYLTRGNGDWDDGHFEHDPSLQIPLFSDAVDVEEKIARATTETAKEVFGISGAGKEETEREYRSRDQPCECLTPMSTALPSYYILESIFTYFILLVEPIILFNWLKYRPWYCQLGVAGLGNIADCAVQPLHAMSRLFKRRFAVELSQSIQRLNRVLLKSKIEAGSLLTHSLDDSTIVIYDLPEVLYRDDNNTRRNLTLDTLFKRGHRAEFLGATLFEQQDGEAGRGKAGGWGAVVTVRDVSWTNEIVYRKCIDVEHDPITGPMIVLRKSSHSQRKHDYLKVSAFSTNGGDQTASDKSDRLKCLIKEFDTVLQCHNARVKHAYAKLHARENQHASFYRHMSATEQANSLFRTIDSDSNGYISKNELQTLIENEKRSRTDLLFNFLTAAPENEEQFVSSADADLLLLNKQESEITTDDYAKVFGVAPISDFERLGQDVHTELKVRQILSNRDKMTTEEKEQVFARLRNGKLREAVARRLDLSKLKKKVQEDASVQPDDMRALEIECKAAARDAVAAKLSILDEHEKSWLLDDLGKLAAAKRQAERERKTMVEDQDGEAMMAKAIIGESIKTDGQDKEREALWKIKNEEALKELEEQVQAEKEAEQYEEAEEEHAKQVERQAETTGNAGDKWALLRVRLEREISQVELIQALVDLITLPGWLETCLELILQRMERRTDLQLANVGVDSSLSSEEQLAQSKARARSLAYGGPGTVGKAGGNSCCGPVEESIDQDTLEARVAVGTLAVHHLEACQHKTVLDTQLSQIDAATQLQGQAQQFDTDQKLIAAELQRSDPLAAHKAFTAGERIVKGQFRRWFVEFLGGIEHYQFDLSEPDDETSRAARQVQQTYGTLMTHPDCPDVLEIDVSGLSQQNAEESARCAFCRPAYLWPVVSFSSAPCRA